MSLFEKHNKSIIISSLIIVIVIMLMIVVQLILGNIIQNKLKDALSKEKKHRYKIDVANVNVNLFTMTLILKGVDISPDSALISELRIPSYHKKNAFKLYIPVVRIRNIGVFDFLFNKKISIDDFIIKDAKFNIYKAVISKSHKPKQETKPDPKYKIDSIVIPGIAGLRINEITITNFNFHIINLLNNDTTFSAKKLDLKYNNIALVNNKPNDSSLRLLVKDITIKMLDEKFDLPGGKYVLEFGDLKYDMRKASFQINDFKITPRYSLDRMVKMSKFQYAIYTCEINSIEIQSIYPMKILSTSDVFISKVLVDSMNLSIYKDKHFPFDTTRRLKIPNQSLKLINSDLYVDSVIIKNSRLTYSELHELTDVPMIVNLGSLNATVNNITSIHDSIAVNPVMTIKLLANLQNRIPMGVNIYFQMNSVADTFSFNGWLGSGNMKLFNKILLPALGIKFDAGILDGVKFTARANPTYSIGEMTMLYHDLDGVVVRKDTKESNKFLSWVANTAMIKNNPIPNKNKRSEPMYFNRVIYKGLGNFLWKTLQSGITATIIPTMNNKVQKQVDNVLGIKKKSIRKREREERRAKKHEK